MDQPVEVTYENGVLRPTVPLASFPEGKRLLVIVLDLEDEAQREAAFGRYMEAQGMYEKVQVPGEPLPSDWRPLRFEGEPLSETIIKERGPR